MNWHLFSAFLLITVVLFLTPGPIVTLIIATGARQGTRAALQTMAGASTGNALLLAAIALGLGWFGAAYLIWLGIQAWRHAGAAVQAAPLGGHVHAWRGFVVAMTNPKSIAFFTAFLPQFIDPALPIERQLLVMCVVSVTLGGLLDSGWAVAAGLGRAWFMKPKHNRLLGRLSGAVLIGGGIWLSLARRPG
jgi:homoserine/homoserine lactone efflux protein